MEGDTTKREENSPEAGHLLAEPGGKEQGGEVGSEVSRHSGIENGDTSTVSTKAHNEHHHHHHHHQQSGAPGGLRPSSSPSPRISSSSPMSKSRGLRGGNHPTGQSDPSMPPVIQTGILPPLNVRGKESQRRHSHDEHSKSGQGSLSLRGAAMAVVSAGVLKEYRRSSAAMHIDLLRVFVPDMLINVSARHVYVTYVQHTEQGG